MCAADDIERGFHGVGRAPFALCEHGCHRAEDVCFVFLEQAVFGEEKIDELLGESDLFFLSGVFDEALDAVKDFGSGDRSLSF